MRPWYTFSQPENVESISAAEDKTAINHKSSLTIFISFILSFVNEKCKLAAATLPKLVPLFRNG
jgi:hypothetical protein